MSSLKYWLWLSSRKGLGGTGMLRLLEHFDAPERIYYADPEEYAQVESLSQMARRELRSKNLEGADRVLEDCQRLGLRIMTIQDSDYPERLHQLPDPPCVLYIQGRLPVMDEEAAIGVVGTREPTLYGQRMAARLGVELARGGAVVVSGIARGLDAAAIRGALRAGGRVVSVLGGGTDVYYPREHRGLYQDVAAAGALVTEYPPGTENKGSHFPIRNRIISGLSLGVVAVECALHSGTMLTMDRALDQDRDLFAVPGMVGEPKSEGTNRLIQQGAKLVTCGEDILVEYRDRFPVKLFREHPMSEQVERQRLEGLTRQKAQEQAKEEPPAPEPDRTAQEDPRELVPRQEQSSRFTDDELDILRALGDKRRSADELVELTQIPVRRVTSALTMLQVRSAVEEGPGRRFASKVRLEP